MLIGTKFGGYLRASALAAIALLLGGCGSSKASTTPTVSVEGIFTSAALTFQASQATQMALTPPTSTPAPTLLPTLALPPSPLATFSFDTPTVDSSGSGACNNALFAGDVTIPDKSKLDPGQKFVKTWLMQNNGTCPWTTSYKISFVDGTQMGGSDAYVPLPVPVNQQVQMSVNMRAPTSPGDYYGRWQMQDDQGKAFGSIVTVVIKVVPLAADTATP